ncbi:MAG: thiamine pyrophosphate-dependent dehydrogenase E1 component subunit alpha [Candidatus Omnitrophica bacterium]|nr:thiamine pyrophosphate-dependent dehydrogenase E1 component subunit alpha [Candidatus Omnitrophota bacterium]
MSKLNIELYKKLYLIRRSEEKIIECYHEDDMKTPMHMSMGQEAIAVGMCHALNSKDQVFGTYRSHALYLAKTQNTDDFFAEIYGKGTALLHGKGGSMHLCAPEHGVMGTSAIVASIIPVAVGAAFANVRVKNGKLVAAFFGDGAVDEGAFWESVNGACLMKLPILFVCEDNGYAVHNPSSKRYGFDSIVEVMKQFRCETVTTASTDVEEIYTIATKAIKDIQNNPRPFFLHMQCYRYLEHVGVHEDYHAGYRSRAEYEKWQKKDPVLLQRKKLKKTGHTEEEILSIEECIKHKVDESIRKARKDPFADGSTLYKEVL